MYFLSITGLDKNPSFAFGQPALQFRLPVAILNCSPGLASAVQDAIKVSVMLARQAYSDHWNLLAQLENLLAPNYQTQLLSSPL